MIVRKVKKMSRERGYAIQEAVSAMNHEHYLRQLAKQRDNHMARKRARQKKEADKVATLTTSNDTENVKNTLNNDITDKEKCQDAKFNTPRYSSDGEVREQRQVSELPVHLL